MVREKHSEVLRRFVNANCTLMSQLFGIMIIETGFSFFDEENITFVVVKKSS